MSIPTNSEIFTLLDRLDQEIADDLETQWLDFKPWNNARDDMRIAVEYAVCFANAQGGVVVFGVADRVRGKAAAILGARGYDLDVWRRGIYDGTRPNLSVELEELSVAEGTGKLVVLRVPPGVNPPYGTVQRLFKQRIGKNCMPMDAHAFARSRVSMGAIDWSGEAAEGVSKDDLDPVEIARARNVLERFRPESELLRVDEGSLLIGLGALRQGHVTRGGLLLFGRERVLNDLCPQHQVHYVYQTSEMRAGRNDPFRCGLLQILDRVEQAFTGPANPEQEVSIGLFKLRIPAFPVDVVREAVLNAVTHRDYTDPGEVLIRHTMKELVITSPGGFLEGITPQKILRHEPVARNRVLAQAFEKLGLVERAGMGRRRIFIPVLEYGKRIPEYESSGSRVILRVFDDAFDERMAVFVAKWRGDGREVDLDGLLILSFLREHAFIDTIGASQLLQLYHGMTHAGSSTDSHSRGSACWNGEARRRQRPTTSARPSPRISSVKRPIRRPGARTPSGSPRWYDSLCKITVPSLPRSAGSFWAWESRTQPELKPRVISNSGLALRDSSDVRECHRRCGISLAPRLTRSKARSSDQALAKRPHKGNPKHGTTQVIFWQ